MLFGTCDQTRIIRISERINRVGSKTQQWIWALFRKGRRKWRVKNLSRKELNIHDVSWLHKTNFKEITHSWFQQVYSLSGASRGFTIRLGWRLRRWKSWSYFIPSFAEENSILTCRQSWKWNRESRNLWRQS